MYSEKDIDEMICRLNSNNEHEALNMIMKLSMQLNKAIEGLEFYSRCQDDEILAYFYKNGDINSSIDIGKKAREILKEIK